MKNLLLAATLLPLCLAAQTGTVQFEPRLRQSEHIIQDWTTTASLRCGTDSIPLSYNDSSFNWEAQLLRPGTYTLRYSTLFQQPRQQQFQHDGHSTQVEYVYLDDFTDDPSQYALLEHLAVGDSCKIAHYGYGCEPWDGGTLVVQRLNKKQFEVTFRQDEQSTRRVLNRAQMRRLVTFERQVRALKDYGYGSSMIYCYEIKHHDTSVFLVKNVEQRWSGMRYLHYYLFDQPTGTPVLPPPMVADDQALVLYAGIDYPVSMWQGNRPLPVENMQVSMGELKVGPQPGTIILNSYWPGPLTLSVETPQDTFYKIFIVKPLPIEVRLGGQFRDGAQLFNGEFKAQGGLSAFVNCCGFDARCEVDSFVVLRHAANGIFEQATNSGARFVPAADTLIQKALPGDTYLFFEINCTCPGDFEPREMPALTVRIRG